MSLFKKVEKVESGPELTSANVDKYKSAADIANRTHPRWI